MSFFCPKIPFNDLGHDNLHQKEHQKLKNDDQNLKNDSKKEKMMNHSTEYLLMKALNFKYQTALPVGDVIELLDKTGQESPIPLKNVCAKVPETLAQELENACNILGMSKRLFVQMAITELLSRYENIAECHDIFEDFENESIGDADKQEDLL